MFPYFWVIMIIIPLSDTTRTVQFRPSDVTYFVTNGQSVTTESARVDCASQCMVFSHCVSWAFDTESDTCYLHPIVGPRREDGQGLLVYTDTAPKCSENGAPELITDVTWERTLTFGSTTPVQRRCPADYIAKLAPATCLDNGQWRTGQCNKRIWRNFSWQHGDTFNIPHTPSVGWSMCLRARANNVNGFELNLLTDSGDIGFQCKVRFNGDDNIIRTTILDTNMGGWGNNAHHLTDPNPPFPFTVGQQFDLKITAVRYNTYQVYVGGSLYGTSRPLPASVIIIDRVQLTGDSILVDTLDVYCS